MNSLSAEADDADALYGLAQATIASHALHVFAEFGIADLFGEMPISVAELAEESQTSPDVLRSVLRLLSGHGIVAQTSEERFTLTRRGELLRSRHPRSMRSIIRLYNTNIRFVIELAHALRHDEPVAEKVFGEPFFEHLRSDPGQGALFDAAMADLSRSASEAVAAAHDFSGYRRIVDVAGGSGTLLASILRANPAATGVLFDLPQVTQHAEELRAATGLGERMTIVAGDFFAEIVGGGDLYLLKSVIHDWPDDRAVEILRNCWRAMPEQSGLVLFERLLIPDNAASEAKSMDLLMRLLFGGRERTRADFERLLADSGFRLTSITPVGSRLYAIEAVPVRTTR